MKKLKIILKYKYIFLLIIVIFSFYITNYFDYKSKYNGDEKYIEGNVLDKKIKPDKTILIVKGKEKILVTIYKKVNVNYNDYVSIKGRLEKPKTNLIFNYKRYLKGKRINYIFIGKDINIIKSNKNIFYSFKNILYKRINRYKSKKYLKVFVMGNKDDIDSDIKNIYKNLGVIHLLSISGSYISILIFILNKLIKNKKVISLFLIIYIIITDFQISIIRSCIYYILFLINKKYKLDIDNKTIIIILGSVLLLINPYYLYDIGFLLSFLVSYSLIYFNYLLENKNYIYKSLLISLITFFTSLPIIINTYYSINFMSILYNLIYVPFSCIILYPLSLLTFIFPILDNLLLIIISIFESISIYLYNIKIFTLSFSQIPFYLYFLYYLLIFLKNNKYLYLIFLFYFFNYYLFIPRIYFLDVGQGDSILIRLKNKNIIIDTGGKYNYDNSNNLVMFYKSVGVKKIDYMIISHGDLDHCKDAINVVNNFKIDKVILNCGPYNELEKKLIKVLDKKKIKYYSCIKELNINNDKLYFLQTREYDNENDNSNVIYTELNQHKLLFMGDAEFEKEKDIIDNYYLSNIDILKVGHHGSKTSSSKVFIKEINPKYSVISVGKNNRYGHPNKETLDNLKDSKIYRTDQDGSIMFKIKNNKLKIETCSP